MEPDMAWLVWVLFFAVIAAASCGFTVLGGYFLRRWLIKPGLTSLWTLRVGAGSRVAPTAVDWRARSYGQCWGRLPGAGGCVAAPLRESGSGPQSRAVRFNIGSSHPR